MCLDGSETPTGITLRIASDMFNGEPAPPPGQDMLAATDRSSPHHAPERNHPYCVDKSNLPFRAKKQQPDSARERQAQTGKTFFKGSVLLHLLNKLTEEQACLISAGACRGERRAQAPEGHTRGNFALPFHIISECGMWK